MSDLTPTCRLYRCRFAFVVLAVAVLALNESYQLSAELPTFQTVFPPLEMARHIVTGNFDGTGAPELAIGRGEFVGAAETELILPSIVIANRIGSPTPISPPYMRYTLVENEGRCFNLTAGDFDGDGVDDLAWTIEFPPKPDLQPVKQSYWARGELGVGLGEAEPFGEDPIVWEATRTLDINNDGTDEILAHDFPHPIGLLQNVAINLHYLDPGSESWFKVTIAAAHNFDIEPLDYDGDGDIDILFGGRVAFVGSNNNLMVIENLGSLNSWATPVDLYSQGEPIYEFDFGDVTGDSRMDLVFALTEVQGYAPGLPGGGFGPPVYLPGARRLLDALIYAEDVDGDNDLDIRVERHFNQPVDTVPVTYYYPNLDGAGTMGARINIAETFPQRRADVNLDEIGDEEELFIVDTEHPLAGEEDELGEISIRSSGGETNIIQTMYGIVDGVALFDAEPDGDLDIVMRVDGEDLLLYNDGEGRMSITAQPVTPQQANEIPAGRFLQISDDLNGDGLADLLSITDGRLFVNFSREVPSAIRSQWNLY